MDGQDQEQTGHQWQCCPAFPSSDSWRMPSNLMAGAPFSDAIDGPPTSRVHVELPLANAFFVHQRRKLAIQPGSLASLLGKCVWPQTFGSMVRTKNTRRLGQNGEPRFKGPSNGRSLPPRHLPHCIPSHVRSRCGSPSPPPRFEQSAPWNIFVKGVRELTRACIVC